MIFGLGIGMSHEQHLSECSLHARLTGGLPADEREAFDRHLLGCVPCQRKVSAWAVGQRSTDSPWENESVSSIELQRYQRLDELCDEFETAWRQGERPEIEAYAARVPAEEQPALRCELLLLACQLEQMSARKEQLRQSREEVAVAPPRVRPPSKPRTLGKYRLDKELSRTAATAVHLAIDPTTGQQVAIKRLRSRISLEADDQRRLDALARQAAGVRHPNLVTLHGLEHSGSHHYWVMDFVEGEPLSAKIAAGPLPEETAARIVAQLAKAVGRVHQAGLVHGHLHPGKILIDGRGEPYLLGLGFPRHMPGSSEHSVSQQLELLGYLPPEQIDRGSTVGPASDIYALGAVLYALLAGVPPFDTTNLRDLFTRLASELPVPPSRHRAGLDAHLEAVCLRCLEKDPAARFPTAEALAEELRACLSPSSAKGRGGKLGLRWFKRWGGGWRGWRRPAR